MRFNCQSASILVAAVGCALFIVGGFMLFPVALDLWECGTEKKSA